MQMYANDSNFANAQLVPSQFTTHATYLGMQSNQGNLNGVSRN
jgi:hypothetical protein